jgi:hypothetical protein
MNQTDNVHRLKEAGWTFFMPPLCFIGLLTNIINIIVFSNKRLRNDKLNQYLLVHSITYFFYLLFCFFSFMIRCQTLWAKMYELYIFNYFTSSLAIFCVLIELFISIERYLIVSNRKPIRDRFIRTRTLLTSLFVFSILFYLPNLFMDDIKHKKIADGFNSTSLKIIYNVESSEFGKSHAGKMITLILSATRTVLFLVLFTIINTMTMSNLENI